MKKLKLFITILIITFILLLINSINVQAALQANSNTQNKKTDNLGNWLTNIRKMEEANGTMGLKETLNSDLTAASESNNIDVHMIKSTEYGAIAILSASGYGNPEIIQKSETKTTTGNETGVYISGGTWEKVASYDRQYGEVNLKYMDMYTHDINSAKIGDALGTATTQNPGCTGWHSTGYTGWIDANYPDFSRGGDGIFSRIYSHIYAGIGNTYSRGVAVCGEGL